MSNSKDTRGLIKMDIYERLKKSGYNCTDDDLLILGLMEKIRKEKIRKKEYMDENDFDKDISKKMNFEEKDLNHDISKMTDEWYKSFGVWLDKQPKHEPVEFTFVTKLKENKKWYYKEDD